jgi:hypothetical protein
MDLGRAAPHDGTSCRPAPVAPAEFDARRQWRAFRIEAQRFSRPGLRADRIGVGAAVLVVHGAMLFGLSKALGPGPPSAAAALTGSEDVLVVDLGAPRPARPRDVPDPPVPRGAPPAEPTMASRQRPEPTEPPVSPAEATSEVSVARLRESASEDLRQQAMAGRGDASVATRSFERPAGAALGELLDRPVELPGRRSRLDRVWAPDGENALAELVRRSTIVREFKDPWGGKWRCAASPLTLNLAVACNFGYAQEPLPDAPLAPNEAPRDGRRPLGAPRP